MYSFNSYKVIRISRAKFHCNRLTTVQDIQDYASLIFWYTVYVFLSIETSVEEVMILLRFICGLVCLSDDNTDRRTLFTALASKPSIHPSIHIFITMRQTHITHTRSHTHRSFISKPSKNINEICIEMDC